MIAYWLMWVAAGAALGLLALWVQDKRRKQKIKKRRSAAFGRSFKVIRETWHHHHYERTPRARLRAERKKEPLRWTVGHKRRPDDPTLARRAAQKAKDAGKVGVERAKVSWMNRTPISERLDQRNTYRDMGPQMMCGSTRTENGHPCRNPRMIGKDHCQVHPRFSLSFGRRDEEGLTRWERKRLLREQERHEREEQERWDRAQRREQEQADRQDMNGNGHRQAGWSWRDDEREREQPSQNGHQNGDGAQADAQPVGADGGGEQS